MPQFRFQGGPNKEMRLVQTEGLGETHAVWKQALTSVLENRSTKSGGKVVPGWINLDDTAFAQVMRISAEQREYFRRARIYLVIVPQLGGDWRIMTKALWEVQGAEASLEATYRSLYWQIKRVVDGPRMKMDEMAEVSEGLSDFFDGLPPNIQQELHSRAMSPQFLITRPDETG